MLTLNNIKNLAKLMMENKIITNQAVNKTIRKITSLYKNSNNLTKREWQLVKESLYELKNPPNSKP